MAGISSDDIQKVREATDIVAVMGERSPVRQRGRDFWCCCPIHNEKTPSCKIDPALQLWHCFGCGEGGDVFAFLMKSEDLTFPEAVRKLADRAGIQIAESDGKPSVAASYKARLKAVCEETAEFYHLQLMRGKTPEAAQARAYLGGRGLGGDVPRTWKLGFAPGRGALVRHLSSKGFTAKEMIDANVAVSGDRSARDRFYNRVMFPIRDEAGDYIAFGGRIMGDGQPKYLNSNETAIFRKSRVLYGLDKAKAGMAATGVAVVVEGYTDVIACHEAGLTNVVATLGTALTMQHIRILSRHAKNRIVYLFDGDAAGQRAADRALSFIDKDMTPEAGRSRIDLCAVTLPDDLDPADFIAQRGADELRACLDKAVPLLQYGIDRRLAEYDLSRAEGRAAAVGAALQVLAPIKGSLLAKEYAVQIAARTKSREDAVLQQLAALVPPAKPADSGTDGAEDIHPASVPAEASTQLGEAELARRKEERKLLRIVAQNPLLAMRHADALAGIQWHNELHGMMAQSILTTLSESPDASAGQIVMEAQMVDPRAAGVLTGGDETDLKDPERTSAFLAEGLQIGDMADAIDAMREQLAHPMDLSEEEREMLFQAIVPMQKDLAQRIKNHRL